MSFIDPDQEIYVYTSPQDSSNPEEIFLTPHDTSPIIYNSPQDLEEIYLTPQDTTPIVYNSPQDLLSRGYIIQKIKEIALTFKDLDTNDIMTIIKNAYDNETGPGGQITDGEIETIITNIKQSIDNLHNPLHITEMLDIVSKTVTPFSIESRDWKKGKVLGRGAFGMVQILTNKKGEQVAYKKISHQSLDENISDDLIREIGSYAILTAIGSKTTPQLVGFNLKEKGLAIAIELANTSVYQWIEAFPTSSQPGYKEGVLKRQQLIPVIVDMLLKSLGEIQSCDIIHGDIKPQNMLLWFNDDGSVKKAAITDFGFATSFPGNGPNLYTSPFRAPEVWDGKRASFASDCWAFGVSVVWICSRIYYYYGSSKQEKNFDQVAHLPTPNMTSRLSKYLRFDQVELINHMIAWEPENRCVKQVVVNFPGADERNWSIPPNPEITDKMLASLFSWMAEIYGKFKLQYHTLALAMDIVFRFYNKLTIDEYRAHELELTGICALNIAALWSEQYSPEIGDFKFVSGSKFTSQNIIDRTFFILKTIHGLLWVPGLDPVIEKFNEMTKDVSKVKGWKTISKFLAKTKDFSLLLQTGSISLDTFLK